MNEWKISIYDFTLDQLDAAVARLLETTPGPKFSTDWSATGPLLDRYRIVFEDKKYLDGTDHVKHGNIMAYTSGCGALDGAFGPNHLIAACRLIVRREVGEMAKVLQFTEEVPEGVPVENMLLLWGETYLVWTQAGYRKAIKDLHAGHDDHGTPVEGYPRFYPAVVTFMPRYRGYHYWFAACSKLDSCIKRYSECLAHLVRLKTEHQVKLQAAKNKAESAEGYHCALCEDQLTQDPSGKWVTDTSQVDYRGFQQYCWIDEQAGSQLHQPIPNQT